MAEKSKEVGKLLIRLYSKDAEARRDAVEELALHIDERVLLRLVEHLDDANKGVRDAISQILFEHCEEHPSMTEPILRYIFVGSIETRNLASEIIVKIGKKSISYMEFAMSCDDRDVRKFIADTLGFIGHADAIPFLVSSFNDEDPNVGFSAIEAVGTIGSEEGFFALEKICEENVELRAMAIEAIGKIGLEQSINVLKRYFSDEDPMVVYSSIDALNNIKTVESYNALNDIYDSLDEMTKDNALDILINLSNSVDIKKMDGKYFHVMKSKYELAEKDEEKRHVLNSFSKVYHSEVTYELLLIAEKEEEFQELIFALLCERIYGKETELTSLIEKTSGVGFEILISVISELEINSATSALSECFSESDDEKKLVVLEALGSLKKDDTSLLLLEMAFEKESEELKVQAIKSFGSLLHQEKFDSFLDLLNSTESEEIAFAILESFASMGGGKSITFFSEMFESSEIDDKSMAIQALSQLDENIFLTSLEDLILSEVTEYIQLGIEIIVDSDISKFNEKLIYIYKKQSVDSRKSIIKHVLKSNIPDEFILQILSDEDKWVQISALETLEALEDGFLPILEKLDISKMDPFAIRSLFDYLQKIVDDDKVKHFLIENINRVDEEIQNLLIGHADEELKTGLKKQLNTEKH